MNVVAKGGKIQRMDIGLKEELFESMRPRKSGLVTRKSTYTEGAPKAGDVLDFKNETELEAYLKEHKLDRNNIEILS